MFAAEFEEPKIGLWGKGLTPYQATKILDWSIFKGHAEDKINVTQNLNFVLEWIENILYKGEKAGYQHFLLFPKCLQKAYSSKAVDELYGV